MDDVRQPDVCRVKSIKAGDADNSLEVGIMLDKETTNPYFIKRVVPWHDDYAPAVTGHNNGFIDNGNFAQAIYFDRAGLEALHSLLTQLLDEQP